MSSYLVRPELLLRHKREASFDTLTSARYFARMWAFKSGTPILIVDGGSGRAVERYSPQKASDIAYLKTEV